MESSSSVLVADVSPLLFEEEYFFFVLPPGDFLGDFRGELPGDFRGELLGDFRGELPGDFRGELPGDFRGELPGDLFFLGEGDGEYRPSRGVMEDFFLGLDTGVEGGEL